MKKRIMFLVSVCLLLAAEPSAYEASASADSSRQTAVRMEALDTESGREGGKAESEEAASGLKSVNRKTGQQSRSGAAKAENKPYKTRLSLGLLLYKGDTAAAGIRYYKNDVYTAVSSDPAVAEISKNGRIKALKCGRADIAIVLDSNGRRDELVLRVHVKASSYAKTQCRGEGAAEIKRQSQAGLAAYRALAPGRTLRLKAEAESGSAEITYDSTDDSVAKVDSAGTVTAEKKGTCTIRAVLQDGKNKAVYRIGLFVGDPQKLTAANEQMDNYFNGSVMVGNSLGVGLERYCRQQYAGFLGDERHFSSGSFSLLNDMQPVSASSLHPVYNGRKYRVKDALKAMGAKKAFLSFGMNDLNIYGVKGTADVYQQFIRELQQNNKGLEVYVVSLTPVRRASGRLENGCIREFNGLMKAYARQTKDVCFIDIFTPLLDGAGLLGAQYCSDGFCHLTNAGYEVWTNRLKQFAGQQIVKEIKAGDAMATVKESRLKQDCRAAEKIVKKLDRGALRTKYLRQLKKLELKRKLASLQPEKTKMDF